MRKRTQCVFLIDFAAMDHTILALEGYPMIHSFANEVMPLEIDPHGTVRIGKTRVTLDTVIAAFADGATPEQIIQQYPSLQLADVYHVIGYCLRRPLEIDAYLQQRRAKADAVRQQ
jgi:uncharacterized protein (DUF433 family)